MKILNEGDKSVHPWWVGRKLKCHGCGRTIQLEAQDEDSVECYWDGKNYFSYRCRNCRTNIVTERGWFAYNR